MNKAFIVVTVIRGMRTKRYFGFERQQVRLLLENEKLNRGDEVYLIKRARIRFLLGVGEGL